MTPLYTVLQLIKDLYETQGSAKASGVLLLIVAIIVGLSVALWAIATQGL